MAKTKTRNRHQWSSPETKNALEINEQTSGKFDLILKKENKPFVHVALDQEMLEALAKGVNAIFK